MAGKGTFWRGQENACAMDPGQIGSWDKGLDGEGKGSLGSLGRKFYQVLG